MIWVQIEFRPEPDGSVVVRYTRGDGSQTWERQKGARAGYFPVHDIMHFCVESVLHLRCGFYGLIAEGWDIREMDGKHAKGRLPAESILVEQLVGLFSTESVTAAPTIAEELNSQMKAYALQLGIAPLRTFSQEELDAVRSALSHWRGKWSALSKGESLRLDFDL